MEYSLRYDVPSIAASVEQCKTEIIAAIEKEGERQWELFSQYSRKLYDVTASKERAGVSTKTLEEFLTYQNPGTAQQGYQFNVSIEDNGVYRVAYVWFRARYVSGANF
ncbi:hypothetical protein OH720_26800 [Pseudomonas sp. WJP1]|uniref:hypothetical protein n=1 Tax=Pseudomonas sp. WJP1 TaxID=2986947 RepID=UPI00234A465D|nr:hypothetical protein [Pseudomonas sp. WJP1]WCM50523.1 hypothetical protein OH720_26800 [Pseudomonas sp. WJP1]